MKNMPGACFPFLFLYSQFSIFASISLFYVSHSSFSIHSMFRSSISSHLTKFWLDRIGGCWVLVVAFRMWVSVVELNQWPALGVRFFRCLLDPFGGGFWWLLDQFGGEIKCLLGLFGGWVS